MLHLGDVKRTTSSTFKTLVGKVSQKIHSLCLNIAFIIYTTTLPVHWARRWVDASDEYWRDVKRLDVFFLSLASLYLSISSVEIIEIWWRPSLRTATVGAMNWHVNRLLFHCTPKEWGKVESKATSAEFLRVILI